MFYIPCYPWCVLCRPLVVGDVNGVVDEAEGVYAVSSHSIDAECDIGYYRQVVVEFIGL